MEKAIFEHYRKKGVDVIKVGVTRIADEKAVNLLAEACDRIEEEAERQRAPVRIVFNCKGVEMIMTRALARLLRFRVRIIKNGGGVALCCLTEPVRRAIEDLGLEGLIPVYKTEAAAVRALAA